MQLLESDPVIDFYKRDVDRTLIRENLKLTPQERLEKLMALQRLAAECDPQSASISSGGERGADSNREEDGGGLGDNRGRRSSA